jgi:serine/threonine protein phosphatase PrpC
MNIFRRILGNSGDEKDENTPQENVSDEATVEEKDATLPQKPYELVDKTEGTEEGRDDITVPDDGEQEESLMDETFEDNDEEEFSVIPNSVTRPLPSEPIMTSTSDGRHLIFGQMTDVGIVRSNNQDSSFAFFAAANSVDDRPDFGLFVVADGMGGHHDGEKASAVTIREVATRMINDIYLPMLVVDNNNDADRPTIAEALTSSIKRANESVLKNVPDGGTTITAMVILGNLAHIGHVGDTRAYIINKQSIDQITRDHSLVQRLIELDQLTPEEAEDHHQRNVLYRAIGQTDDIEVDTLTRRLQAGSKVLICSDGLWGLIPDSEIQRIVNQHENPQDACYELIEIANTNGGHDNITAIIVAMP